MNKNQALEEIGDVIIEKPFSFSVKGKRLFIYQETLGRKLFIRDYIKRLEINYPLLVKSPYIESARLVKEHEKEVCSIIAICTLKGKDEIMNPSKIDERRSFISKTLDNDDKSALLIYCLSESGKADEYMNALGITKDKERREKVMKVKDTSNIFSFGGLTMYGTVINTAAEKYGWTLDYILWGISFTNLRLILADAPSTILLTDKERKQVKVSNDSTTFSGDDPRQLDEFKKLFND